MKHKPPKTMPTIDANWNKVEVSSGKINNRAIGETILIQNH